MHFTHPQNAVYEPIKNYQNLSHKKFKIFFNFDSWSQKFNCYNWRKNEVNNSIVTIVVKNHSHIKRNSFAFLRWLRNNRMMKNWIISRNIYVLHIMRNQQVWAVFMQLIYLPMQLWQRSDWYAILNTQVMQCNAMWNTQVASSTLAEKPPSIKVWQSRANFAKFRQKYPKAQYFIHDIVSLKLGSPDPQIEMVW